MATLVEVPHLGMDLVEVTLVEWLVAEGDHVAKGDPIVTVETDKTNHDLEAEVAGVILQLRGKQGDVIPVGDPIDWIVGEVEQAPTLPTGGADAAADKSPTPVVPTVAEPTVAEKSIVDSDAEPTPTTDTRDERGLASPAARREAAAQGVDIQDVSGSGPDGVVYRADVQATAGRADAAPTPASEALAQGELVALSRIQQITGERTQASFRDVPHFYLERELEVDALLDLRQELAERLDHKPSLGCLLCFAIARTLTGHPRLNGRLIGTDQLELRRHVHLGVAVAGKDGLAVPVIRNAGEMPFKAFGERYRALIRRAVRRELTAEDMSGGTFTVSNLGMFGIDRFSAIINTPQSAIIALGRRRTVPEWADREWQPKTVVSATLSVDHRAADGADGARFLVDLAERCRHWSLLL
ncbi:MAG: dihydrolipoamide acetyltransferase family protein [Salinisphaera sp.]|jgi:pyruvate dehydrogenase E2 component (dihydrolipoamide acetyltransferase)|nr:dihydrolipoamide acetyltransferase family protein [Salinisphaera sp.]